MSSKMAPKADASTDSAGPANTYRPSAGTSSASEAAAMHARTRNATSYTTTAHPGQSSIPSIPLSAAATSASAQRSSAPRETIAYSPTIGTSSASQAAALHASRTFQSRIVEANHSPMSSRAPNKSTAQATANTPKNIANPMMISHPSASTSRASASQAAEIHTRKTVQGTPPPSRSLNPLILSISSEPLSPLIMEFARGPSEDICRRLLTIYFEEFFGDFDSEEISERDGN